MITRQVTAHQRRQEHVQNLPRSRGAFVFGVRILDLLFVDSEGFVGYVMLEAVLAIVITKLLQFSILGEVRSGVSRTAALGFQRVDFGLFGSLVDRVP